jgi:hypothetical protein
MYLSTLAQDSADQRPYKTLVELYLFSILVPLDDWVLAKEFLAYNDILPESDREVRLNASLP